MHTLLILYQWTAYGLIFALTATCVIVPFLKAAHDEARREQHQSHRRTTTTIPTLRPRRTSSIINHRS